MGVDAQRRLERAQRRQGLVERQNRAVALPLNQLALHMAAQSSY